MKRFRLWSTAFVLCALALPALGASRMFIKFETPSVIGGSTEPGHTGEIEVLSWSHGFVQPTSPTRSQAGAGTVEQATHQDFSFTKNYDSSTEALLKSAWSGKKYRKVTVTCYRDDGLDTLPQLHLTIVMDHVVISGLSLSGGTGDVETITLDYGEVKYDYAARKGK